jgi:general secretion pathway protein G
MVAILIIGLLSTIVLINVLPLGDKGRVTAAQTQVHEIEQALELYRADMAAYPSMEEGLEALVKAPAGNPRVDHYQEGGYLRGGRIPKDPWGNPYQYLIPGEHGAVDVYSMGADGRPGGEGINADIGNWSGGT